MPIFRWSRSVVDPKNSMGRQFFSKNGTKIFEMVFCRGYSDINPSYLWLKNSSYIIFWLSYILNKENHRKNCFFNITIRAILLVIISITRRFIMLNNMMEKLNKSFANILLFWKAIKILVKLLFLFFTTVLTMTKLLPSLNISTGHRTISGKKLGYVQQKLLCNGHSC